MISKSIFRYISDFDDFEIVTLTRVIVVVLGTCVTIIGLYDGCYTEGFDFLTGIKTVHKNNWILTLLTVLDFVLTIALEIKIENDNEQVLGLNRGPLKFSRLTLRFLSFLIAGKHYF